MNPVGRSTAADETLALVSQLKALTSEHDFLQKQYRAWAREYALTGVPHERDEFNRVLDRIADLKQEMADVRTALQALAAIGGAR